MRRFKQEIAQRLASILDADPADLATRLVAPPRPEMGDVSFPCFPLAKERRQPPPKVAADLAAAWAAAAPPSDAPASAAAGIAAPGIAAEPAGPYLNFRIADDLLAAELHGVAARARAGRLDPAVEPASRGTVTIDFSSPNIAKQFSIAHLRSTATGWALQQLYEFAGYRVVGINHIGDWGTQFGLLIDGFLRRGDRAALDASPITYLHDLYVSLSEEKDRDPDVADHARATFLALERGDPQARELWDLFRSLSLREFDRIYAHLGISFTQVAGEAFYEDKLEPLFRRFADAGIAREDDGAWIVDVEGSNAPLLLRKRDGASTYGMRDLAAVEYRHHAYAFAKNLYVTDLRQGPHFAQVFAAYARLGAPEADAAARCGHVPFGAVRIDGEIGSTRRGTILLLEAYLRELAAKVLALIDEKNPSLADKERVAHDIAMGAVTFEMLRRDRRNDVHFSSEECLRTDGETGPRVQYLHARLCSLRRTFADTFGHEPPPAAAPADVASPFASPAAHHMLRTALAFEDAVDRALDDNAPHHVAQYLLELADAFNVFWREERVIDATDEAASAARLAVMDALRALIARALALLGIRSPEAM